MAFGHLCSATGRPSGLSLSKHAHEFLLIQACSIDISFWPVSGREYEALWSFCVNKIIHCSSFLSFTSENMLEGETT